MDFQGIKDLIANKFGPDAILRVETTGIEPALVIRTALIAEVCQELRNNPLTYFDMLACLSGVDNGVEGNLFCVVYNLLSIPNKQRLTLKVEVQNDRSAEDLPVVPTVSDVWKTADWHERETFDLLGIYFEGHQDLRRILLPDDWQGFPLRKDYKAQEYYHGIKVD